MNISPRALARIERAVRKVESSAPRPLAQPIPPFTPTGGWLAVVATTISARSGTTLGKGTVTLQLITVSGSTYTYGAMPGPGATVTALSALSATLAVGTIVKVCQVNGQWFIDYVAC